MDSYGCPIVHSLVVDIPHPLLWSCSWDSLLLIVVLRWGSQEQLHRVVVLWWGHPTPCCGLVVGTPTPCCGLVVGTPTPCCGLVVGTPTPCYGLVVGTPYSLLWSCGGDPLLPIIVLWWRPPTPYYSLMEGTDLLLPVVVLWLGPLLLVVVLWWRPPIPYCGLVMGTPCSLL